MFDLDQEDYTPLVDDYPEVESGDLSLVSLEGLQGDFDPQMATTLPMAGLSIYFTDFILANNGMVGV